MYNNICNVLGNVPPTYYPVGYCYCHHHRNEGWRKVGVWMPHHDLCHLAVEDVSDTYLCRWRMEREGLTGERTKKMEITFFFKALV